MTDEEKVECAYHWDKFHTSLLSGGPIHKIPDKYKLTMEEATQWAEGLCESMRAITITFDEAAEAFKSLGRALNGLKEKEIGKSAT